MNNSMMKIDLSDEVLTSDSSAANQSKYNGWVVAFVNGLHKDHQWLQCGEVRKFPRQISGWIDEFSGGFNACFDHCQNRWHPRAAHLHLTIIGGSSVCF